MPLKSFLLGIFRHEHVESYNWWNVNANIKLM